MQGSAWCRSRRELSNEYLLAKIGGDTAENGPPEVWGKIFQYYSFVSLIGTLADEISITKSGNDEICTIGDNRSNIDSSLHLASLIFDTKPFWSAQVFFVCCCGSQLALKTSHALMRTIPGAMLSLNWQMTLSSALVCTV